MHSNVENVSCLTLIRDQVAQQREALEAMHHEVATLRRALVALTVQLFPTPWPQPPEPGASIAVWAETKIRMRLWARVSVQDRSRFR